MDLGDGLRSLDLKRYEAAFRENAIEADVLHDLTDQDLEKLGVLLGHRRRLRGRSPSQTVHLRQKSHPRP